MADGSTHDTIIRGGLIYDGSGGPAYRGDVVIDGDRITYVGKHAPGHGRVEVDARGKAVAPGFINMLAHPEESLLADGRALSDLRQGVTLEVMGEDSMGPLTPAMQQLMVQRQADIHYRRLDDPGGISRQAGEARHFTQRRVLRRRGDGADEPSRRSGRRA
jgi:N-acyl-D-aspartate/D-glutamate deacylase